MTGLISPTAFLIILASLVLLVAVIFGVPALYNKWALDRAVEEAVNADEEDLPDVPS